MNGIEAITNTIIDEARQKAAEIVAAGELEAARVIGDAEKEAASRVSSAASAAEDSALDALSREKQQGNLAYKKEISSYRQKLVYEVFDRAFDRLADLPDGEYFELLKKLSLACTDDRGGELVLNGRDREKFGKRLSSETGLKLSERTAAIAGGVIVSFGDVDNNASLEVVIRELREQCSFEVSETLFGKEGESVG